MRLNACIAAFLLMCAPVIGQQAGDESHAKQILQGLANAQMNWGLKMNSSGVAISVKETAREKINDQTVVSYRLFATGISKDKIYSIYMTPFDLHPVQLLDGVTFDVSGQAVCAGKADTCGDADKPNDPIDLKVSAGKGEPKRFSLISDDGQIKAFTSVVPFPIIGHDQGCSVEVLLLWQSAEGVLIHGTGFELNSDVHFEGFSEGEAQHGDSKTDNVGTVWEVISPYVKGKSNGKAMVSLKSKMCNPSVTYNWGQNSYRTQ